MVLALLAALALQDAPDLAEWVRRLGDDSIEVREEASRELLRAGKAAEPLLREARESASPEVRARAFAVLAEMERRERAREFDAGPSLITLHRQDAPVREVLQEIQRQSATGLTFPDIPETERVSVDFDRTPFFSAIDTLCRNHGGLQWWRHRDAAGLHAVGLERKPYAPCPQVIVDQYMLRLTSAHMRKPVGGEPFIAFLEFAWAWEKGTRPVAARVVLDEVKDDAGGRYAARTPDWSAETFGTRHALPSSWTFALPSSRPEKPQTLAVVKGRLEVLIPEGIDEFVFENPERAVGTARKCGGVEVRLVSFQRDADRMHVGVEVRPPQAAKGLDLASAYKGIGWRDSALVSSSQTSDRMTVHFAFKAPGGAGEALRLARPPGLRERSVPFEFRDLGIR